MSMSIVFDGLKEKREELRISQRDLAEKAGVSRMTIYHAEHGLPVYYASHEKITAALNNLRAEQGE